MLSYLFSLRTKSEKSQIISVGDHLSPPYGTYASTFYNLDSSIWMYASSIDDLS